MTLNNNTEIARIVRRYGEAKGAAERHTAWGIRHAGNALRKGFTPTESILAGMNELDLAIEMMPELTHG